MNNNVKIVFIMAGDTEAAKCTRILDNYMKTRKTLLIGLCKSF
jgi:hypothetical protein